ncbi:TIGR02677 family protein [Frankia sp. QA3]|uniref:TIGR02677 family protein n=1 Tax=Frankia sp. QA3 TaxID=710111 RepID=UPI000269CA42|nr:TIGR02677 family protein [Frankia sp. QA3]EIV94701.1 TIGR02677 family protein [Frankia sp. QA3]
MRAAEPGDAPGAGRGEVNTSVFAYVTESADYRVILGVFAGTFFAELTPDDVTARLAEAGVVLPVETVASRLESLRGWGNLDVSASVGSVSTVADYYRRRNRYLITRIGQEVHELVEGVLAQVDDVRDVSLSRLDALAAALEALLRLDLERADPAVLADHVRAVFDPHRAFSAEITQFFAAINQWQSRFDLDETEFAFFSEVLVGYVGERLDAMERRARPIAALLGALEPDVPVLVARARDGLAARVADAGLTGVRVRAEHGSSAADWENLNAWFLGRPGAPSRIATLGRDAVNAVRTLTQNLTRLSRSGVGSTSRRADYLRLAGWFEQAGHDDPEAAHQLAAAAFGLFGARHLGAAAGDETDPVPSATSWWDAPRARVPVSLRQRGDTTNRGRSGQLLDRSRERAHLLERRRRAEELATAARAELLASTTGPDGALGDGTRLSEQALARLQRLLGPAVAAMGPGRAKGEAEADGLRCVVERRPGQPTRLHTPAGTLTVHDLALTLLPVQEA